MNNYRIRKTGNRNAAKNRNNWPFNTVSSWRFKHQFPGISRQAEKKIRHGHIVYRAILGATGINISVYRIMGQVCSLNSIDHPEAKKDTAERYQEYKEQLNREPEPFRSNKPGSVYDPRINSRIIVQYIGELRVTNEEIATRTHGFVKHLDADCKISLLEYRTEAQLENGKRALLKSRPYLSTITYYTDDLFRHSLFTVRSRKQAIRLALQVMTTSYGKGMMEVQAKEEELDRQTEREYDDYDDGDAYADSGEVYNEEPSDDDHGTFVVELGPTN